MCETNLKGRPQTSQSNHPNPILGFTAAFFFPSNVYIHAIRTWPQAMVKTDDTNRLYDQLIFITGSLHW